MQRRRTVLECFIFTLTIALALSHQALATSTFTRIADLLPQYRDLTVIGTSPPFHLQLADRGGFGQFTFHAQDWYWPDGGEYQLLSLRVDFDGDGVYDWDNTATYDRSWTYPQPTSWADQYDMVVEARLMNHTGQGDIETWHIPFTVARRTPRLYRNNHGDELTQLVDEDCAAKLPVLIVEGFDPLNQTFAEHVEYQFKDLLDDLYARNSEVFILNFSDNQRDMKQNADVVLEALESIHGFSPNNEMTVIGFSMGGVIARYALAKAEDDAIPHHVGVFVSLDSPHEGANVSPDVQSQLASIQSSNAVVEDLHTLMGCMAAKQMLFWNEYDRDATEFFSFRAARNKLNGNGMPHNSFNVAISNGNRYHSHGNGWLTQGRHLLDFSVLFHGEGLSVLHCDAFDLDLGAGSTTSYYANVWKTSWAFGIDFEATLQFDPCFVPTNSAIGITMEQMQTSDYNEVGDITYMPQSPFDDVLYQDVTRIHAAVSPETRAKIVNAMARVTTIAISYVAVDGGAIPPEALTQHVLVPNVVCIQPHTVTVGGSPVTYVFKSWDDGSVENPRTFYGSHDIARTVTMKVHLATSISQLGNTQRRVAEAMQAIGSSYQAVYESGGYIWHVRNRYGGGWEAEQCLSCDGVAFGAQQGPVVTTQVIGGNGDQVQVHAAWFTDGGPIVYRASDVDNGTTWPWQWRCEHWDQLSHPLRVVLPELNCDAPGAPNPCWPALFVVEGDDGLGREPGVYYYKQPRLQSEPYLVPGTGGEVSEAEATYCGDCGYGYQVAFVRDGKMFVGSFKDPDPNGTGVWPVVCEVAADLTTTGWTASSPSIVSDGGKAFATWCETSGQSRNIVFRQCVAGVWSAREYIPLSNCSAGSPVLGINSACGTLNLLWQDGGHIKRSTRSMSGGGWNGTDDYGAGLGANLGIREYTGIAMWTSGATAPYVVNVMSDLACSSGGGGGCPTVDVEEAGGWITENTILARSASGIAADDALMLTHTPVLESGRYIVRVREDENELTTLDRARLAVVDHPPGTELFAAGSLTLVGRREAAYRITTDKAADITAIVNGGSSGWIGQPGDIVTVDMDAPVQVHRPGAEGGIGTITASLKEGPSGGGGDALRPTGATTNRDAPWLDQTGIRIQLPDGAGGWRDVTHQYPRERPSASLVDSLAHGTYRIVFVGRHQLGFVGRIVPTASGVTTETLSPIQAVHTRLGSVLAATAGTGSSTSLAPGDTLTLSFTAPEPKDGTVRDVVLLTHGLYTSNIPDRRGLPVEPALPRSFALEQNVPNPFSGTTTIRFALPTASSVKIELFDLFGRRIRTLTDAQWAAGYHQVEWDRRDASGNTVHSGVFMYRMTAGTFADNKRTVVLQ